MLPQSHLRHRYKRSVESTNPEGQPKISRTSHLTSQPREGETSSSSSGHHQGWWNQVQADCKETAPDAISFWTDELACVEIEIAFPESRHGMQAAIKNLEAFFTGALQRRQVEVHEHRLTPQERQQFKEAKGTEVTNFLSAKAFEALPPLERYRTISEYLETQGLVKSWADPCCWLWKPAGDITEGMIAGHVDDFLFAGPKDDQRWSSIGQIIKHRFKWSDWEEGKFVQCSVQIEATSEGFELSQPTYLDKVSETHLCPTHRREKNQPATEWERTKLRAILGALSWHAQQVSPHLSAEVGLLLSGVTVSTVDTKGRVNSLLQKAKARTDHKLKIQRVPEHVPIRLFVWADASGQNRRDGSSTQGLFVGVAPLTLLEGAFETVVPIAWHASKIDRVTRSHGAAEASAVINGEDLLHARFQYGEFMHQPNIFDVDSTVNQITGCAVSDSRTAFDKLQTEELSVKGAERRTDIEVLCLKSAQRQSQVMIRWVHSEAQLSNALTKSGAKELELYYKSSQRWRIVSDDYMGSTRKRKQQGINTFEHSSKTPGKLL